MRGDSSDSCLGRVHSHGRETPSIEVGMIRDCISSHDHERARCGDGDATILQPSKAGSGGDVSCCSPQTPNANSALNRRLDLATRSR
jgi:hypothetical protein